MDKLNRLLGELWGAVLTEYEFDVFKNKVKLVFECRESGNVEVFTVIFEKVSSIFYGEESGEDRLEIEDLEDIDDIGYVDLHSIHFCSKEERDKVEIVSDSGLKSYYCYPNFVLDIKFDGALLIEAQIVTINGEKFTDLI